MKAELQTARQAGKTNEITDLLLLIEHLSHGNGVLSPQVKSARNRQNQRRSGRKTTQWVRRFKVGDAIVSTQDADQTRFIVQRIDSETERYECAGGSLGAPMFIPYADARPGPWKDPVATLAACDALYHAVCDYCDASEDAATMLGSALSKYELALEGLK